jgi:hypothetical protein|tara:strand:- start:120 stop:281 length:162 start_codon:yes stop_codon:yes gene_type:complete
MLIGIGYYGKCPESFTDFSKSWKLFLEPRCHTPQSESFLCAGSESQKNGRMMA